MGEVNILRIKEFREQRGMSQVALAAAVGVSPPAVCKWEKGLADPSFTNLRTLVAVLGCTMDELARDAPATTPPSEAAS